MKTLETRIIKFQEEEREYDVVDRNIDQPAPRYFISYRQGIPFISDEVPRDYMHPMILHKLTEFELLQEENDKCLKALKVELKSLNEEQLKEYIPFRTEVFQCLISYLEKHLPNSPHLPEMKKSLSYLETL
ncbi:hypothetical protein COU53_03545 [Candidatus Pacearchaeota archaeon CG10_big_fil_rev_8_21_14_0_10_30_48]|nr:MAG: hypothetical protein COU53_03545 [Candidatus Pacearchaeota archaeon CG10_big_fil_rev_8_21_14_0_10_30_48]